MARVSDDAFDVTTKAGLGAVTVALAKEWRADGIRVTLVDPGMVDTPTAAESAS